MDLAEIWDSLSELSKIVVPSESELFERVNLTIMVYNAKRHEVTDLEIANTRAFLSSDLYAMVEVCYQPALDDLISTDLELHRVEGQTFKEELDEASKTFSKSQSIDIARKMQKSNERYLEAYHNYHSSKKIVNVYDKTMKMGGQVLNSMARRAKEA